MSAAELSALRLGAEVLVELAGARRDACLVWRAPDREWRILLREGRPERITDAAGRQSASRPHVVAVVRGFALASVGRFEVEPLPGSLEPLLRLDTLGEVAAALCHGLAAEQLAAVEEARGDQAATPTATFDAACRAVSGLCSAALPRPDAATRLGALLHGRSLAERRGWVTLAVLGGLRLEPEPAIESPLPVESMPAVESPPAAHPGSLRQLPEDPRARECALEIHAAWQRAPEQTLYELLGIPADADADSIRKAYFEVAKRWHSDRFSGIDIGDEARAEAEELFARCAEAHKTLCDPEQRKSHDFILDRKAKGLPTDVNAIFEAEALFRKAQVLVRRGQAAAAEPLLRQAIELNRGEADFWAYLGLAIHAAQGKAGLEEARAAVARALEMDAKLAVGHEFLGHIARVEGQLREAQSHFRRALQLNSKSVEAARELRLIATRLAKAEEQKKGLSGLLGGLLKR